jgi:predicted hydrocarbon binding protein
MIRISQHRKDKNLNDLQSFIHDLEEIQRQVDFWEIKIEECIGSGSLALVELTENTAVLSPQAFESMCYCIDQTIDGEFRAIFGKKVIVSLVAVDSSYWEIEGTEEFELAMSEKYGDFDG